MINLPAALRGVQARLRAQPKRWLVTGVAGFIGSNLLEALLRLDQSVVGLDNLSTGHARNLHEIRNRTTARQWARFESVADDIRDFAVCSRAMAGVQHVLHQAALGSVPRSLEDPMTSHAVNVDGFVNMLQAAREARVDGFVFAASSSTYGDEHTLPQREDRIGRPLSPYALTKLVDELYADLFARCFGFRSTGLRYFNVYGPRQDPGGSYAAVIPKWIAAMLREEDVVINGDGETSRDFCYVADVVQANLLAALASDDAAGQIYNVAGGERTSLNVLFDKIRSSLGQHEVRYSRRPVHGDFRAGDMRHTQADLSKASRLLGYEPTHSMDRGLSEAMSWYIDFLGAERRRERLA